MKNRKIRVGIMGCAAIAKRSVVPAFLAHSGYEVVAIASRLRMKARQFADELMPDATAVSALSYDELAQSKDVDLVYCPLPTGLHYEWAKKCLKYDKHVLCEKSLASTDGQVRDLVALARKRGLLLMESFQFRFHAQNLYVKRLLAEKTIGSVRQLVVRFGIPPFPEGSANIRYSRDLGGGALLDNGAYTVKASTYLLGQDISILAATHGGETPALGNVDLSGAIMMQTSDGVPIQTAYGFDHFYQNGYEIWGTDGKITTTRAFTARADFAAPVIVETKSGRVEKTFRDDHFARLLDYVEAAIAAGRFEEEYGENLLQARLLADARRKMA